MKSCEKIIKIELRRSFDPTSNAAAGSVKTPERNQWQRARVTGLIRRIKTEADAIRPGLWISAAVWPYYLDKRGWRLSEGYNDYYQDSKGWLVTGVIEAIAPMFYSGVSDDFERWRILLADFLADSHGKTVYPGIGADYDNFEVIAQRLEAARRAGAPGHAIFSYGAFDSRGYWGELAQGPYAAPANCRGSQVITFRLARCKTQVKANLGYSSQDYNRTSMSKPAF